MSGLIFISPGSFDSPDGLPKIPLGRIEPIESASYDWAADRLGDGPVEKWTDIVSGAVFAAPSGQSDKWPTASSGSVRFDGSNDVADVTGLVGGQPKTIVIVGRIPGAVNNARFFTGGSGAKFEFGIWQNAWTLSAGLTFKVPTPATADDQWHVFVIVVDGANSIVSIDGVESTGNSGANPGTTLRLGMLDANYVPAEIKRFAVIPYAAGAGERERLRSSLASRYGIA